MTNSSYESESIKEIRLADNKRRDTLSRAACASVTVIIILFAIKDTLMGSHSMALTLAGFATSNMLALAIHSRLKNLNILTYYLIFSCSSLCLFLVSHGGTDNSGLLWTPTYPVLMFSVLRVRTAVIATTASLVLICIILFVPNNAVYHASYTEFTKLAGIGAYILTAAFTFYQSHAREISSEAVTRLNHELSHIAATDDLTQLSNRRDMSLRLEFECKRAKRTKKAFSIILCDVDYFKKINDSFGHNIGDQALRVLSQMLTGRFRETDKVGRWGGEEFLIILPDTPLNEAIDLANDVRRSICQASLFPNMPNRLVTVSAGVASSQQSIEMSELIGFADKALYRAKDKGRNRVEPETSN